ncbi:hypothetical protein PX554_13080 [Sphingomonas sp. H39-1-10]|uniref:hypothetical protein n=1 Tax=Sphingomonas pollutisoli TaxID=3030829 RepID=UPI0023B9188D|nr:hypothetical protein [Sphingomonas pollutisoli]MDF0489070.1 hypothetical protein [Sphingomonas pollutisoli]
MPVLPLIPVATAADATWPDTRIARLEALAMVQELELALLTHDSATLVLDDWCVRHDLAPAGTQIVADRQPGAERPAPPEVRAALHVGADEPVRYRLVHLRCGARVLSVAENWYVPARLTPEMNHALDSTDVSFGRIVRPLGFRRVGLGSRILWAPLGEDWDARTADSAIKDRTGKNLVIPARVIENRAVLVLPDGTPFSQVIENYTGAVLGAQPPGARR